MGRRTLPPGPGCPPWSHPYQEGTCSALGGFAVTLEQGTTALEQGTRNRDNNLRSRERWWQQPPGMGSDQELVAVAHHTVSAKQCLIVPNTQMDAAVSRREGRPNTSSCLFGEIPAQCKIWKGSWTRGVCGGRATIAAASSLHPWSRGRVPSRSGRAVLGTPSSGKGLPVHSPSHPPMGALSGSAPVSRDTLPSRH